MSSSRTKTPVKGPSHDREKRHTRPRGSPDRGLRGWPAGRLPDRTDLHPDPREDRHRERARGLRHREDPGDVVRFAARRAAARGRGGGARGDHANARPRPHRSRPERPRRGAGGAHPGGRDGAVLLGVGDAFAQERQRLDRRDPGAVSAGGRDRDGRGQARAGGRRHRFRLPVRR